MNNQKDDEFNRNLEEAVKPVADEIAQVVVKKIEPFTRIVTLMGFAVSTIFLIVRLVQGRFQDGSTRLLFWQPEGSILVYILIIVFSIITLWHLASTIRFFINRGKERKK